MMQKRINRQGGTPGLPLESRKMVDAGPRSDGTQGSLQPGLKTPLAGTDNLTSYSQAPGLASTPRKERAGLDRLQALHNDLALVPHLALRRSIADISLEIVAVVESLGDAAAAPAHGRSE